MKKMLLLSVIAGVIGFQTEAKAARDCSAAYDQVYNIVANWDDTTQTNLREIVSMTGYANSSNLRSQVSTLAGSMQHTSRNSRNSTTLALRALVECYNN